MINLKQLCWLAPFVCLGLITLVLLRPWPILTPPSTSRIVTDSEGTKVEIPLPFRGVVPGLPLGDFLQKTHAPETVLKMGGSRDRSGFARTLVARIYPWLVKNDNLWDTPENVESILAHDVGGVYFGGDRRLGLTVVSIYPHPNDGVNATFAMTRIMNDVIGQRERAEVFISDYQQAFADLKKDLQPSTLTSRPRSIRMVYSARNWSHLWASGGGEDQYVGVTDGAEGFMATGREGDAERVLAMNPDLIVLAVGDAHDFLHDPRWQGLKAVQTRRVYGNVTDLAGYTFDIDTPPLGTRWMAEIAHPERLHPQLRELVRDHYIKAYGHSLSDNEIDKMLEVEANKETAGYARFMKNDHAVKRGVQQ